MTGYMKLMGGVLLAAFLTACGGGGGSPGATGPGGTNGGTGTVTLVVSISDASGNATSSVSLGGSYQAKATLRTAAGAPVSDTLVTFSIANSTLATLNPATGLTDSTGVAQVTIAPASLTAVGATTLTASAAVGTATVTGKIDFAVSSSSLSLSPITVGSSSLPSGGNTSVSISALVGGTPSTGTPVNVAFTPSCGRINGVAPSFSVTTNGSGVASAVYSAVNTDGSLCSGQVTLTASSAGTSPRTTSINVAPPVANALTFVSATPSQIFVSGSGALEQSNVVFRALSGTTPLANIPVRFSILTNPGGVGLNATGSTADVTATTDSTGNVSVTVFSGSIPGPVKVRATLVADASVFAETQNLSVSSGPPSQRFISVSVGTFNIEGWNRDGTSTTVTARLADRQGNPVENGTVVNFTTEGGQVASSCATVKVNGISSCSVDFISQNPRPAGGRVSVLAYASGTKDYVDVNGNNRYDAGTDTLVQIGDAYRDDNENSAYDGGEFVIPRLGATACSGSGWPFTARANTCDAGLATTVRQQAVLLFSSTSPQLFITSNSTSFFSFLLASLDNSLLPMPAGTTVAVETSDVTPGTEACAVDKLFGPEVPNISPSPNPSENLATAHQVTLKGCLSGDLLSIKVKVPSGLETTIVIPLQ